MLGVAASLPRCFASDDGESRAVRAADQGAATVPPSFVIARMGSYRLVLGAALVTAIVTATLTAALASFASGTLPQAVHRQLATASGTSVVVSGRG